LVLTACDLPVGISKHGLDVRYQSNVVNLITTQIKLLDDVLCSFISNGIATAMHLMKALIHQEGIDNILSALGADFVVVEKHLP